MNTYGVSGILRLEWGVPSDARDSFIKYPKLQKTGQTNVLVYRADTLPEDSGSIESPCRTGSRPVSRRHMREHGVLDVPFFPCRLFEWEHHGNASRRLGHWAA